MEISWHAVVLLLIVSRMSMYATLGKTILLPLLFHAYFNKEHIKPYKHFEHRHILHTFVILSYSSQIAGWCKETSWSSQHHFKKSYTDALGNTAKKKA